MDHIFPTSHEPDGMSILQTSQTLPSQQALQPGSQNARTTLESANVFRNNAVPAFLQSWLDRKRGPSPVEKQDPLHPVKAPVLPKVRDMINCLTQKEKKPKAQSNAQDLDPMLMTVRRLRQIYTPPPPH